MKAKTKTKAKEFNAMNIAELSNEIVALMREQFNLRMQHATKQLTQTHNLNAVRRKIARVKTFLHEKNRSKS